jgi:hypothetical protein
MLSVVQPNLLHMNWIPQCREENQVSKANRSLVVQSQCAAMDGGLDRVVDWRAVAFPSPFQSVISMIGPASSAIAKPFLLYF